MAAIRWNNDVDLMCLKQPHHSMTMYTILPSFYECNICDWNPLLAISDNGGQCIIKSFVFYFFALPILTMISKLVFYVQITRWYRAPEVILCQNYTTAVDVWSGKMISSLTIFRYSLFSSSNFFLSSVVPH